VQLGGLPQRVESVLGQAEPLADRFRELGDVEDVGAPTW
jgi:hypothetical protein